MLVETGRISGALLGLVITAFGIRKIWTIIFIVSIIASLLMYFIYR